MLKSGFEIHCSKKSFELILNQPDHMKIFKLII